MIERLVSTCRDVDAIVGRLHRFAENLWVASRGPRGGLIATHRQTGKILRGSWAREVLERQEGDGGNGGGSGKGNGASGGSGATGGEPASSSKPVLRIRPPANKAEKGPSQPKIPDPVLKIRPNAKEPEKAVDVEELASTEEVRAGVLEKIDKALKDDIRIPTYQQREFGDAFRKVMGVLPLMAANRVSIHLRDAKFYASPRDLAGGLLAVAKRNLESRLQIASDLTGIKRSQGRPDNYYIKQIMESLSKMKSPGAERLMLEINSANSDIESTLTGSFIPAGFFDNANGGIHLDGALKLQGAPLGKRSHENPDIMLPHEIYSHEIGHVIDGPRFELSRSSQWDDAFRREIKVPGFPLTQYATMNPQEGFAEFSRLVYGSKLPFSVIEKEFPKASAFFKAHELWPEQKDIERSARESIPEIFDKPIPLGRGHIDTLLAGIKDFFRRHIPDLFDKTVRKIFPEVDR